MTRKQPKLQLDSESAILQAVKGFPTVLNLAEVVYFLRLNEPEVFQAMREQGLPGRQVGTEWRFLTMAVAYWLWTSPSPASCPEPVDAELIPF